jgi:hypothetical protein
MPMVLMTWALSPFLQPIPMPADETPPNVSFMRIFRLNKEEWPYIGLAIFASLCMGAVMPIYAILFGQVRHFLDKH